LQNDDSGNHEVMAMINVVMVVFVFVFVFVVVVVVVVVFVVVVVVVVMMMTRYCSLMHTLFMSVPPVISFSQHLTCPCIEATNNGVCPRSF
jgi:hypothetical protein